MSNANLDGVGADCIRDAAYDFTSGARKCFDFEELADRAREGASGAAENACIYYSDCLDIISRYERDADVSDYLIGEVTYKAEDWQSAMTAYATAVAFSIASQDVEEALDALTGSATIHGNTELDETDIRASHDCPHGWAVHDREGEDGVHYWTEPHLEGCRAVAVKAGGLWFSLTWTPESGED